MSDPKNAPQPAIRDDELLTTALEKLLYLESRLDASEAAREAAEREVSRQRSLLQQARRASSDWQRRAVAAESTAEGAERELARIRTQHAAPSLAPRDTEEELRQRLAEAEERLSLYARERESWLDRMAALGQLRSSGSNIGSSVGEGDEDAGITLDLGSFIAELRAEMLALRKGRPLTGPPGGIRPDVRKLVEEAPPVEHDVESLLSNVRLTRAERTLAQLCAVELDSPSATVRRRAAERLEEADIAVLNPLVVERLERESDAGVRAALVALLDRTGGESATLPLKTRVNDPDVRVRARVVEALGRRKELDVAAALRDPAAAVRRRALSQLALTDSDAVDLLTDALADEDASVRRMAALLLAGRGGAEAGAVLVTMARSGDGEIAEIAARRLAADGARTSNNR